MVRNQSVVLVFVLSLLWLLLFGALVIDAAPLGDHCIDVGHDVTIDPTFCGCTWGTVLVRGEAVEGAVVTLSYAGQTMSQTTFIDTQVEPFPYFSMSAHHFENKAVRGDLLTFTATYAGKTLTRTVRAMPVGENGEQEIVFAFDDDGWLPQAVGSYTKTMALGSNDTLWLGGQDGVISLNLSTGMTQTYALPSITAIATITENVYALGAQSFHQWDGTHWSDMTPSLAGSWSDVAVDEIGRIFVAGKINSQGVLIVYDGTWTTLKTFESTLNAKSVIIDKNGTIWVGTASSGLFSFDGTTWQNTKVGDGGVSNYIHTLYADEEAVYVGARPHLTTLPPGYAGGIGRYDLVANTWQLFTTTNGLLADGRFTLAPNDIYAISVGANGNIFAGSDEGIYEQIDSVQWKYHPVAGMENNSVNAIVSNQTSLYLLGNQLYQLRGGEFPTPPITTIDVATTITNAIVLEALGNDSDETGSQIVAWEWRDQSNALLCSTQSCYIPFTLLQTIPTTVTLLVEDDEAQTFSVTKTVQTADALPTSVHLNTAKTTTSPTLLISYILLTLIGTMIVWSKRTAWKQLSKKQPMAGGSEEEARAERE